MRYAGIKSPVRRLAICGVALNCGEPFNEERSARFKERVRHRERVGSDSENLVILRENIGSSPSDESVEPSTKAGRFKPLLAKKRCEKSLFLGSRKPLTIYFET